MSNCENKIYSVTDINYKRLGREGFRKRTGELRRVAGELESLGNIDIRTFAEVATFNTTRTKTTSVARPKYNVVATCIYCIDYANSNSAG